MKRFFAYLTLLIFSFLWFLGCSKSTVRWLSEKGLVADDYRYGDLYRFSHLPEFRTPVEKCDDTPKFTTQIDSIHLILAGDSFTEEGRIFASDFQAGHFTRVHVASPTSVSIDSNQHNVLVIQTVERHFRERFQEVYKNVLVNQEIKLTPPDVSENLLALRIPYNEERHEAALFSHDFFFRIKEWKALLNDRIFGRIDENVIRSVDKKHIFYAVDRKPGVTSSQESISDEQILEYVENINQTAQYYQKLGFQEVILSIIPNKSSILGQSDGEYNRLIERIQAHPNLRVKCLDMYHPLMKLGESGFDKGDTHWSCAGKSIWIETVNTSLFQKKPADKTAGL